MENHHHKLRLWAWAAAAAILFLAVFMTDQFFLLQKAHSTFENYYAFRGCTQLLDRTPDYGTCRTNGGQVIKIVKIGNRWFLEGDGPGIW